MDIAKLQEWARENFAAAIEPLPLDYGVARLLVQTGQLGEAVLHEQDVDKEISDVFFVLLALANRSGVDLEAALGRHIVERKPQEILERITK
ncbi:MAG: hypothetical protein JNL82_07115 [Myxococcales bacterium]|jgi:NTP pyrophosphatase (non-canonical NTP hydrolase)|nr:hypothetical protein [Myxococcales bacterium]